MENKYLAKILPFLDEIEKDRRKQFEEYFRTAPMWLMDGGRAGKRDGFRTGGRACRHDFLYRERSDQSH